MWPDLVKPQTAQARRAVLPPLRTELEKAGEPQSVRPTTVRPPPAATPSVTPLFGTLSDQSLNTLVSIVRPIAKSASDDP